MGLPGGGDYELPSRLRLQMVRHCFKRRFVSSSPPKGLHGGKELPRGASRKAAAPFEHGTEMVTGPLVSAIIANFKGAIHLRLCLPSLARKTFSSRLGALTSGFLLGTKMPQSAGELGFRIGRFCSFHRRSAGTGWAARLALRRLCF